MRFNKKIRIGNFEISERSPAFIIAEAGVNHNGNTSLAKKLIDLAKDAGVNAVKFQAFKTEELILKNIRKAPYQKLTTASSESQFRMLKKLELTPDQNFQLKEYCQRKKIIFLTTPFDESSLEDLDFLNLPAYKVSSTDITNLPFLKKIAQKNKPVLLSTGMSYLREVETALREIHPCNKDIILLQCTTDYPLNLNEVNLNVIRTFKEKFDILVGFSDHTPGIGASAYAIPLGAKVIEKHFTLNKKMEGPDHKASLDPNELKEFVQEIRKVERYLGTSAKVPTLSETKTRLSLQKHFVASKEIKKGEVFGPNNTIAKRTGGKGISPIYYRRVYGQIAHKNYAKDTVINL